MMSYSLDLEFNDKHENGRYIFSLVESYKSMPIGIIVWKTEKSVTVYTIHILDYIKDWLSSADHHIDMIHSDSHHKLLLEKKLSKEKLRLYPFKFNSKKIQTSAVPLVTIHFKNEIDLINFKLRWC